MDHKRFLALLLCAAVLCSVLAGCGGTSASSSTSGSASGAASASQSVPSSTAQADTGRLTPADFDENSLFSITDTADAFAPCLGWGPGVSGCSLKSVIAAASLLHWAEGCNLSIQTTEAIQDAYTQWFDGLSADEQESFADAWPLIRADAETLLTDKDSMTGRIEDAGLNAQKLPGCSEENWNVLSDVIDALVPASSEY